MKILTKKLTLPAIILASLTLTQADPFRNLDFEMVNTSSIQSGQGPISDLLPGWQLSYGSVPITQIGFNCSTGIVSREAYRQFEYLKDYPVLGDHVLYFAYGYGEWGPYSPYTLTQRGDIPEGVVSLNFQGVYDDFWNVGMYTALTGIRSVSLNGTIVDPFDISSFAGEKDVELSLSIFSPAGDPISSWYAPAVLDGISFVVLPEPCTAFLFSLGSLVIIWRIGHRGKT
jgi:hypothetical protein